MKEYDHTMKVLVDADPLAIARFVLGRSKHMQTLAEANGGLKKENQKMLDLFKDSPAYGWMTESARKEGREEAYRQMLVALVEAQFPNLVPLAQKQVALVRDQDRLQQAILCVSRSQDASELEVLLLALAEQKEEG